MHKVRGRLCGHIRCGNSSSRAANGDDDERERLHCKILPQVREGDGGGGGEGGRGGGGGGGGLVDGGGAREHATR